ncbi:hypothetical protein BDW02DRAFT_276949 [Decorospora gaudefroyi]|uniref:Uncharacterized protein n=1 Tax=Decorospora gaudefroyi TaxID=184978 RepID=A0A6A5KWP0_9PLEO|nr:hypothetical protein BDW02DRAFT_276949 [Decorospora gaudefroyi]
MAAYIHIYRGGIAFLSTPHHPPGRLNDAATGSDVVATAVPLTPTSPSSVGGDGTPAAQIYPRRCCVAVSRSLCAETPRSLYPHLNVAIAPHDPQNSNDVNGRLESIYRLLLSQLLSLYCTFARPVKSACGRSERDLKHIMFSTRPPVSVLRELIAGFA